MAVDGYGTIGDDSVSISEIESGNLSRINSGKAVNKLDIFLGCVV